MTKEKKTEKEAAVKREFLEPLVTNLDGDVYALTSELPDQVKAMLVARQSRAQTRDARELLWEEFRALDEEKAGRKAKNIIDGFGDDSVREDASAYVMVQNASILATTFGIVHPLLTRIEASTRYINWGGKESGRYLYKELEFGENEEAKQVYEAAMEVCFGTYRKLWQPVWDFVVASNPRDEATSEAAYLSAVRGRVCDNLKGLLPLSALTNFGLHGDFRALSELIMNLRAEGNEEMRRMGDEMAAELAKVNPEFIAVVNNEHGEAWTNYKRQRETYLAENHQLEAMPKEGNKKPGVELAVSTRHFLYTAAKAFLKSQNPNVDKGVLNRRAQTIAKNGEMEKILADLGELRTNRRHELPDFLRCVVLKIRFRQISIGSLKDLFRHRRILWRTKPDLSGQNGWHIPKDIGAMGGVVLGKYQEAQRLSAESVAWMRGNVDEEAARYCLTQGMLTTFDIDCDLVEGYWISELRSIASGFEEYRWFAQELLRSMVKKMPALATLGSFTNMNEYQLGRIKEAVRQDLRGR
ncbi:FAD-dependent thymidylate synthase [Candidatus Collierbacteria bacterium]|nr:FAD-dependent thymidylate synthase [Candidatus Collierbacteria bacterium]